MTFPFRASAVARLILGLAIALPYNSLAVDSLTATNGPFVLPPVEVTASRIGKSLTSPDYDNALEQNNKVPGGFTLRDTFAMNRGRASGFQDLLDFVPGVTLQSRNDMELTKISIRGSGILADDEPLGVIFLLDGFPMNQGDGEVLLEDFNLGSIQYAEVFRGANAFKYGAITLGGAVNLVSRTGYDAPLFESRVEGGSFGFFRGQADSGVVSGPLDLFGSVSGRRRDGFRDHSSEDTENINSNFGYKFAGNFENRFYVSLERTDRLSSGGITKQQMENDPTVAGPDAIDQNTGKQWSFLRLADKVSYKNDALRADAGGYWWYRNLTERGLYSADDPEGIQAYFSHNFGFIFNVTLETDPFGSKNLLTLGATPTFEREVDKNFQNLSGIRGTNTAADAEWSINAPFYAEDQQYLGENLSLIAGVQAIYAQRHFSDFFVASPGGDQSGNLVFRSINPKAGVIYELDTNSQVYANFSRSWQPPSFDNMVDFGDQPFDSLELTPLTPQHAWTIEIGTRGEKGRFEWDLSLYHSWVRNELLDINDAAGVDRGAVNIKRSYHQGIEAGLDIDIADSLFVEKTGERIADRVVLKQTYTLNDFHFDGDPVYGRNRIAGVPIHFYQARLMYEAPCGFYGGPSLQWNMTRYPVDHANTFFADDYVLIGFEIGVQLKDNLKLFFEARNLGDQRYPAAVDPIPSARTVDEADIFHPGDGRSFYGGLSWAF
jgi:iron complex outermembrane receptor protein